VGLVLNWAFALLGVGLILYRLLFGIGAVTNLSDGYPWGLWVGVDILAGIAVAAGGFVMAGTIYLFGGHKYHELARQAILVAFIGYLCYMIGTIIDIGRYWNIPWIFISQNHHSPLFEIAMCVFMYTTVLFLEVLPIVFEKLQMKKVQEIWYSFSPWLVIFMLCVFCWWLTHTLAWVIALFAILMFWEILMRKDIMPRDKQTPILLILAGVTFSTMHQSTLGALYLIEAEQLDVLWYTASMPILFFISAITVAPAVIMFVAISADRFWGHKANIKLLSSFAKAMPLLLGLYLIVKFSDLVARGAIGSIFRINNQSALWWVEVGLGVILPLLLFVFSRGENRRAGMYWGSAFVIIGLILNRLNVAVMGIKSPNWGTYYPHWAEILITIGIFSIGLLGFRYAVSYLPIYQHASE
jgi:formate dehydrogenase iron-sulfur subunit